MAQTRFTCTLTKADEPSCPSYARVRSWIPREPVPALVLATVDGIARAHVDWADSKGLNRWERKALELAEERSQLR